MRKALALALLLSVGLPLTAQQAQAQFAFIPYLGYNTEEGAGLLVGVGTQFGLPISAPVALALRPSVEYQFVDETDDVSVTALQVNGDVIASFGAPGASIRPYAGAGLAMRYVSVDVEGFDCDDVPGLECSDTAFGLNLLGGAQFGSGFAQPFLQGRLTMADGSAFSILGGVVLAL